MSQGDVIAGWATGIVLGIGTVWVAYKIARPRLVSALGQVTEQEVRKLTDIPAEVRGVVAVVAGTVVLSATDVDPAPTTEESQTNDSNTDAEA